MFITAFFASYGTPATGLAPTITIRRVSDGVSVITAASMTELGGGFYRYNFTGFDPAQEYAIVCDGGATLDATDRYTVASTGDSGTLAQVKAKSDLLPADPASQASVNTSITGAKDSIESKITTAEANIRGADNDTLRTLSQQLDGVDSKAVTIDNVADAIKAKTDNLPADPASQSALNSAVAAAEANIRGADGDTLELLSDQLDGNLSAVQSIQNNTTRRIDVPSRLIRPDDGFKTYRIILGLYDNTGNPEAPDSVPTIQIENVSGVVRLTETPFTQFAGQTGQYFYDYDLTSASTLENLIVTVKVVEGGVTSYHRRTTDVTEFEADINEVQANVTAIKTKTDQLPANTSQELTTIKTNVGTVQSTLDNAATGLVAIKGTVDVVDGLADAIKERTDRLPDAPATQSTVNAIKTKTDYLPANTAQELTEIDNAIADDKATISALLTNASFGLDALRALLDAIDNSTELAARFTEIKGAGWTAETLVQLDTLIDAIKAKTDLLPNTTQELNAIDTEIAAIRLKTDQLPVNTAQELNDIDTQIAGVRTKTDQLPANTTQELADIDTEIAAVRAKTNQLPADTALELTAIDTELAGVRAKTDQLPVNTAQELLDIDTQIAATRERTDRLPDDPADNSEILDAITSAETTLVANQTIMKAGDDNRSARLGILQTDVTSIKARTDAFPTDQTVFPTMLSEIQSLRALVSRLPSTSDMANPTQIEAMLDSLEAQLTTIMNNLQADVTFIKDIEGGRWRLVGTQMVFYKDDNVTEVARFNLTDQNGIPSINSVFDRARV